MTRFFAHFRIVSMTALLSAVALTGLATGTAAAERPLSGASAVTSGPIITGAACTSAELLMVTGEGFTPGGLVDVEITGGRVSVPVFGPNGSVDPAWGYVPANLESATATEVYSVRASQSIFGPNGSMDPALGYEAGGYVGFAVRYDCTGPVMVRAYDHQLAAWSGQLPVLASGQVAG
jgi:hypothetical protein